MKITTRINREDPELVETLLQRGVKSRLVKGGVIVELPALREPADGYDGEYRIPKQAAGFMLFIDIVESGGGRTNSGSGIVVCGVSGKPLRPYYIHQHGKLANGIHARFAVSTAVVTITGYRHESRITIRKHEIIREGEIARIKTIMIWEDDLNLLPGKFSNFLAAGKAAVEKGNCYHCREVHFARAK